MSGTNGRALVLVPVLKYTPVSVFRLREPEARRAEIVSLAEAIDLVTISEIVSVSKMQPSTYLSKGKIEDVSVIIEAEEIPLVIIDAHLTPVQQRNLERIWECKVIDRTALILEIFGERAQTNEGKLQVELAALEYQKSRLVRSWTHLERQRGGHGFLGGPGESQIESDRRQLQERIIVLKKKLEKVKQTRTLHRKTRQAIPYPIVALVGYTNAGKSTLFNRMTASDVYAADKLFATLDPTMRAITLASGQKILLSDTVGFVSDLPTQLVAAFRATLEEVLEADILLHVRDYSHPETEFQKQDVLEVLLALGVNADADIIEVCNKADRLEESIRDTLRSDTLGSQSRVMISARSGAGVGELERVIDEHITRGHEIILVDIPFQDTALRAWLYENGDVLSSQTDERFYHMRVRLTQANVGRFNQMQEKHNPLRRTN